MSTARRPLIAGHDFDLTRDTLVAYSQNKISRDEAIKQLVAANWSGNGIADILDKVDENTRRTT